METLRALVAAAGGDTTLEGWTGFERRTGKDHKIYRTFVSPCGRRFKTVVAAVRFLGLEVEMTKPVAHKRSAAAMEKLRARLISATGAAAAA